ncbi:MAG: DUF350 domain-containing protein [Wolbachia pipientis]
MFGSSYEERVLLDSAVGNNTCTSTSNPISSSQISDKRKEKIGNPSTSKTKELQRIIHKKVTKKTHSNESPKEGDGTIKRCIELFNNRADPNVLIQLEKLLREQEEYQKYYNYYTEKFLPTLKTKVIESEELMKPSALNNEEKSSQRSPTIKEKILKIISEITGITNKSSDKNHSSSTIQNQKSRKNNQTDRQDNAMGLFKKKSFPAEVPNSTSSDMTPQEEDSAGKGVSGIGTPGTYNLLRNSGYHSTSTFLKSKQSQARKKITQSQLSSQSDLSIDSKDLKNEKPNITVNAVEVPSGANTSKLSSSSDLDSGINSSSLASSSRRNSLTSISSEESVHLKLNPAEENNGLQLEDEGKTKLAHPNKTRPKGPSGRRSPSKYYKKTEEGPHCVISVTGSKVKDTMQSNNYGNNSKIKNKNLHVALVISSALLAIGCIVAGAMTSGLVGAGLFVVAAVFATAAAAELCSNFLSSKLTSISVSPLVDNKELTR